ncbi:PEP-CTERM sorting domain-containing protein [Deefgea chitinilytica]|uniref:PEP-CTERM sorting domain-containing protein n=1 Tax=Deefgea chitinilytica TaxID=570276 RepID=A0ABS2CE04_9NEIS|nr:MULTISPECIES: FxDxF family PEP-CTERM protein [Deefgea]MBM5572360.1 PEP-CTERM sorting domain-containing protein [Deefgea chitinilytica]MBM9889596.1 PEP-CTERM sorting domain-containing protein [Deefgea sp. CFH1-16]
MNIKHLAVAAVIGFSAVASQAAIKNVTFTNGSSITFGEKITKLGNSWTFDSFTFKVNDNSPILFSFFADPAKKNTGTINSLKLTLLNGKSKVGDTQTFNSSTGSFLFSGDTFASNKNYKFRIDGLSTDFRGDLNYTVAAVPEPETYALMGMGLVGLLAARRRKMKATK